MFHLQKSNNEVVNKKNNYYPNRMEVQGLDDLINIVQYDHSGFKHRGNLRSNENFESTDVLIGDIDNTGTEIEVSWWTLEKIKEIFQGIEVYIVPSKNHGIDKVVTKSIQVLDKDGKPLIDDKGKKIIQRKNIIQAKRPKLHLYFPLSRVFDNYEEITTLYKNFIDKYPFVDGSLKDPARYIDGNMNNPFRIDECCHLTGVALDTLIDYKPKVVVKSKWSNPENFVGIHQGTDGRNNILISKLSQLRTKGWTPNMIRHYGFELNQTFVPPIEEDEFERCIDYVVSPMNGFNPDDYLKMMQETYTHLTIGGTCWILEDENIQNCKSYATVKTELQHLRYKIQKDEMRQVFDDWAQSTATIRYNDVVFEDDIVDKANRFGLKKYNQWRGWRVRPDENGDCSLLHDLLFRIICNSRKEEYEYFLNWLADMVQHPTNKRQHQTAISLKGKKGIGKGTLYESLKLLFHAANELQTAQRNDLFSRFNSALLGKVMVFGDEIEWPGDPQMEGLFKDLITNPQLRVEEKFQKAFKTKNACRFILSTNEEWSVPVGEGERRFVVFEPSTEEKGNTTYFKNVVNQMRGYDDNDDKEATVRPANGAGRLLWELMNRDIGGVNWTRVPKNEAFDEQRSRKFDIVERFIESSIEALKDGIVGFNSTSTMLVVNDGYNQRYSFYIFIDRFNKGEIAVSRSELWKCFMKYQESFSTSKERLYPITEKRFHSRFKEILFGSDNWKKVKKMINGTDYYVISGIGAFRAWKKWLRK